MTALIEVKSVSKHFGSIQAVDSVSFTVNRGEVLGFLGPNGAGKSTAVNLAVGLLEPDSGHIAIGGHGCPTAHAVRAKIGVATQALVPMPR